MERTPVLGGLTRVCVLTLGLASPAVAAEPTFALDTVLVPTFEAIPQELKPEADRIRQQVESALSRQFVVLPLDEVPAFTAFSADIYMSSCPDGRYVECGLVLGIRGSVEWVVGGQVRPVDEGLQVTFSIIDVTEATVRHQVDFILDGRSDEEMLRSVAVMVSYAQDGLLDGQDIRRTEVSADEQAPSERQQTLAEGAALQALDASEGEVQRGSGKRARRRVHMGDLAHFDGMEGGTPWERVRMGKREFVRYRNSGSSLAEWARRQRGRQGELLIHASLMTLGEGPWRQSYQAWYALEAVDLQQVEQVVLLDQARMLDRSWDFGISAGVLPWLEVGVFGGPRLSVFEHRVQRVVEGEEPRRRALEQQVVNTWSVGGRVGFVPLPTFVARPSAHLGLYYWQGNRQDKIIEVPEGIAEVERNWMLLVQVSPGVEVSVGKHFYVWGRLQVDVPVAGRVAQMVDSAGVLLADHPTVDTTDDGVQVGGSLGLTARIDLLGSKARRRPRPD